MRLISLSCVWDFVVFSAGRILLYLQLVRLSHNRIMYWPVYVACNHFYRNNHSNKRWRHGTRGRCARTIVMRIKWPVIKFANVHIYVRLELFPHSSLNSQGFETECGSQYYMHWDHQTDSAAAHLASCRLASTSRTRLSTWPHIWGVIFFKVSPGGQDLEAFILSK